MKLHEDHPQRPIYDGLAQWEETLLDQAALLPTVLLRLCRIRLARAIRQIDAELERRHAGSARPDADERLWRQR